MEMFLPSYMTVMIFHFHILNLPFLSSNVPSGPYGVYISQLIMYARCCSYYDDFRHRHKVIPERLLSEGCRYERQRNSFKSFIADIEISLRNIKGQYRTWLGIHYSFIPC